MPASGEPRVSIVYVDSILESFRVVPFALISNITFSQHFAAFAICHRARQSAKMAAALLRKVVFMLRGGVRLPFAEVRWRLRKMRASHSMKFESNTSSISSH